MRIPATILIAWWLYVGAMTPVLYPFQPSVWQWQPRERFLHKEFCELNARRLRSEGLEAVCVWRND